MSEPSVSKQNFMELTSIGSCTPEDFSDLRELHKMAINHSGWHFYSLAEVAAKLREIDEPDYTTSLLNENVLLAKMNNTLVGTASWRPSSRHPQTAVISQLYINPLFADGGIATALIEETEQVAYNNGFRWISAQADFNSRAFYARLGYESQGFKDSKPDRSIQYPLQIMTRHISSQYSGSDGKKNNTGVLRVHNQ